MAMPESETALKELMWRILGDLLEEGVVVKIADNLTHLLSFFATGRGSSRLLINVPIAFQHPRRSSVLDLPRYYGGWARFQLVLTASLHSQHIPDRPRDGLLEAKRDSPMSITRECIVVPRQVLHGLLKALHIQLDHPTSHKFKLVVRRFFYAPEHA
ncbi:hypothetical protein NP493_530g01017 [Ridgeia piscesae]|uniref:Uncharacterized protein n=1 Tax=Ridgeia piscesae TaxID=27915 RepID=A0AAD9KWE1_RIDPI|nr:hypothetical protein NP493_530g01017 [Ridgeia piscesae]